MNNNDNLRSIIIVALICLLIYFLLLDNNEGFDEGRKHPVDKMITHKINEPVKDCPSCPIPYIDYEPLDSILEDIVDVKNNNGCGKKSKSIRQFHDEFFGFRDHTCDNSSMRVDTVDKVLDMQSDGVLDKIDQPIKIGDIYDNLTHNMNLYDKNCARTVGFDNINHEGYNIHYGTAGLSNTRDIWKYE